MIEPGKKVVVTTKHRGVFYGLLESRDCGEFVLTDARVCMFWSKETRGFVGLASTGPLSDSRVSTAAPRLEVFDVTAVLECTDEAAKQWESF